MIKEFKNADYGNVNAALIEEQPYFCLVDLARILDIPNAQEMRKGIPSCELVTLEVKINRKNYKRLFIHAKHIGSFIFKSRKSSAQRINDWLYRIVIPQLDGRLDYYIEDFEDQEKVLKFLDEYQDLKIRNSILETDRKLNATKIKYLDSLVGSRSYVDLEMVTKVIKFHRLKSSELYKILRATHILDENNQPYQEYCDKKYFRVVESKVAASGSVVTSYRTYVYKSGLSFIEKILTEYEVIHNDRERERVLHCS